MRCNVQNFSGIYRDPGRTLGPKEGSNRRVRNLGAWIVRKREGVENGLAGLVLFGSITILAKVLPTIAITFRRIFRNQSSEL